MFFKICFSIFHLGQLQESWTSAFSTVVEGLSYIRGGFVSWFQRAYRMLEDGLGRGLRGLIVRWREGSWFQGAYCTLKDCFGDGFRGLMVCWGGMVHGQEGDWLR